MRSKDSFNAAAKLYDEVRPTYPKKVIDWIINVTGINPKNDELLEIAPGTGQATMRFGERGYKIHSVELGDQLANILRENCKNMDVTVDVAPFEEWIAPLNKKYKMIYCATAFHWLDPEVKYVKTYNLLKEDGYLVLMWNNSVGNVNNEVLDEAYKILFSYHEEKSFSTKSKEKNELDDQINASIKTIEASGYYKVSDILSHEWSMMQSREKTIKGFYSQSSYLSLESDIKDTLTSRLNILFESLNNEIESKYVTNVYICSRVKK